MLNRNKIISSLGLCIALTLPTAFASPDQGMHKKRYLKHHQMNMDMMQILTETMSIVRNMNHKPSATDKEQLDKMIKQLNKMMNNHKEMGQHAGKHGDSETGKHHQHMMMNN